MPSAKLSRIAVITGASSGIGKATAEEFAKHGYTVVVLARRKALLDRLILQLKKRHPHGQFHALQCDVTSWDAVRAAAEHLAHHVTHVNVLVNNAGAFEHKALEESSPEKVSEMINVNVRGVIYMSKAMLPLLRKAVAGGQRAKIVNVSSIGGLWGFSKMTVYTATKFAVTGFSSALRRELQPQGIEVGSIHPGPVDSKEPGLGEAEPARRPMVMLPAQIASQIYALSRSRKARRISHPAFSLLRLLETFSPDLVDRLLKKIL